MIQKVTQDVNYRNKKDISVLCKIQQSVAANLKMLSINMTFVCDMNCWSLDNDNEIGEITIPAKIISFVIYLIGMLGISSILGVIHYEKFGQDPQKRSFADLIFTFNCIMFMITWPIIETISQIRWFFGPVGYSMTIFKNYLSSCLLCIPLGFTESILFRLLMIYSWKKCAMINDEFCAMFFNVFNFIVVQMISVFRLMTGQFEMNQSFYIYSGIEVNVDKPGQVQKI